MKQSTGSFAVFPYLLLEQGEEKAISSGHCLSSGGPRFFPPSSRGFSETSHNRVFVSLHYVCFLISNTEQAAVLLLCWEP